MTLWKDTKNHEDEGQREKLKELDQEELEEEFMVLDNQTVTKLIYPSF
jgi:hypothetical protein